MPVSLVRLAVLTGCLLLAAVISTGCRNRVDLSPLNSLAKTDINMVADTSQRELHRLLETLLVKLYKRNPAELAKGGTTTISGRREQIFGRPGRLVFEELGQHQGTEAINLAFAADYPGDRIFALMVGLVGMVRSSYNWQDEQFMFDSLDQQLLFASARNLEVVAWRLSNSRDPEGELLLLSNSRAGEPENLSYERLFGKMIAIQDMMAFVTAGKWQRGINQAVRGAARMVLVPMGL